MRRFIARTGIALAALLLLAACGTPVPRDKTAYVGEWRSPAMYLVITPDGSVHYKRLKGGGNVSIDAPLQGFRGDDFVVGVGPIHTTFVVTRPPHEENGQWKMVVDGVELTRTSTLQPAPGPDDQRAGDQRPSGEPLRA
jgi:hypothetical protein